MKISKVLFLFALTFLFNAGFAQQNFKDSIWRGSVTFDIGVSSIGGSYGGYSISSAYAMRKNHNVLELLFGFDSQLGRRGEEKNPRIAARTSSPSRTTN
jgi:hypothetical protein